MQADFVLDALTTVLDWDLPEDCNTEALSAQVCQLANIDEGWRSSDWRGGDWRSDAWNAAVNITLH